MSSQNQVPEVTFRSVDESQSIQNAPTNVAGHLGVTQRGIPNVPKRLGSWRDFVRSFGTYLAASDLPFAAKRFLDGGGILYVNRVVHLDGGGDSTAVASSKTLQTTGGGATKGTVTGTVPGVKHWTGSENLYCWGFPNTFDIAIDIDAGGVTLASATAVAATKTTGNANFVTSDGDTILYRSGPSFDPGPIRTITLAGVTGGAATAAQIASNLADQGIGIHAVVSGSAVVITSDLRGAASALEFTGGTALTALGLSVEVRSGSGNIGDLAHVTENELASLAVVAASGAVFSVNQSTGIPSIHVGTAGSGHSIQMSASNAARQRLTDGLGLDTSIHSGTSDTPVDTLTVTAAQDGVADPGTWGDDLTIDSANATRNPSTRFKWTVKYKGTVVDTQDELSMDPTDSRYVVAVFANHGYIKVADEDAYGDGGLGSYTTARPAVQSATALEGGDDGLTSLAAADYQGDSTKKTGFYAFDSNLSISLLGTPGYTDRPTAAALLSYCDARGNVGAVLDVPPSLNPSQVPDWRQALNAYAGLGAAFNTKNGAAYFGRLKITDPLTSLSRYISPMGDVMAAMANARIGGQTSAAGPIAGPNGGVLAAGTPPVLDVEQAIDRSSDGSTLLTYGVNFIYSDPVYGIVIWGERDLQATPSDLDRFPQARWEIYARQSLRPTIEPLVLFQPNDETAWAATRDKVNPWIRAEKAKRAISDAFWLNDATVNTPTEIAAHRQNPKLYVKHNLHAEFVEVSIVTVAQTTTIAH